MSVGNQIIPGQSVSGNQYLSAPFRTIVPIAGFTNKPLNAPATGTYSVYGVLLPKTSPAVRIKIYIIEINLTSLGVNQNSVNNTLPSPYISQLGLIFPTAFIWSGNNVNIDVLNAGQTFSLLNMAGTNVTNLQGSSVVMGL
ncbi:MAG: hypothetical protein K6T73_09465 [Candidatus Bathyarchaeota archaeon]|nr:hypothetical protein [Candidatus Bathyarchaeota archaeon]